MSGLRAWLEQNGLDHLAALFEANDIDLDILADLTERDLATLGLSLGNRRRVLKAIAAGHPATAAAAEPPASGEAERRQVTVLFADLVGSTALSGMLDPEQLGTLIRRYQDAAAGAIGRFGGFVAKFMGDGVLAYFGFPRAFEDAAERAVRAALALLAEVAGIARPDGQTLQARIGIATGLVVIGEIVGTGTAQEHMVVGETPNLAARLQALAEPDTVLVSAATRHLLGGMFALDPLGAQTLKGFAAPVPVWRVAGEAPVESRFAAIRAQGAAPFVGRRHEMALLLDRWRLACRGEGQVVTVVGEPGIGKSRSIEALRDALGDEPYTRIHLQCSVYHGDSALYPVIRHLARAARFAADDPAEARLAKLGRLFAARAACDPAALPLLAGLLSIPVPSPPRPLTPAEAKAAVIALLVEEIVRLAGAGPVLLILEDAQWADATTLELMTGLADAICTARLLAVVTARPDFSPPWQARAHATLLTLGRLDRGDCAALVAGVAAAHGLPADTVAAILAKTDGVPLFVEELTRSVVEGAGGAGTPVPATLQDSLMARLDRLGEAREVAQVASVIGRTFTGDLLDALLPGRAAPLKVALARLGAAGIVFPDGQGGERRYRFKHALVRDAAYESLLLARRRDWHARIVRVLEERFPKVAAEEPELLAYHCAAAGLMAEACDHRARAGDRAIGRSAYPEAIGHFQAGLEAAGTLDDPAGRRRRQCDFLLKLGPALMVVHGMQSEAVQDAYRRAAELGEGLDEVGPLYKAKWGLWLAANIGRKTALARDRAAELVDLARRSGDDDLLLEAYHCGWSTAFFRGDVPASLELGRLGADSYDIDRHRHLAHVFGGHDAGACAHITNAVSAELSGEHAPARAGMAQALALAERLNHPNSLAHVHFGSAMCCQLAGDRAGAAAAAARGAALAERFGLGPYRSVGGVLVAWAEAEGAGLDAAARRIEAGIDGAAASGPLPHYYLGLAGEVLLAAGRAGEGLACLDRALAAIGEPGVGFFLPEIHRLRGACLLALGRGNREAARQAFDAAREVAIRQGAAIFARRAEAALADLADGAGRS